MEHTAPPPTETQHEQNTDSKKSTFSLESLKKLWRSSQLARIGIGLVAAILVLTGVLITMSILENNGQEGITPDTNEAEATANITTTKDKNDDDFFAQLSDTIIYYSFAQTSNSKNMVQATPTYNENRILEIGYPDRLKFLTSPDGKWLVRWNDSRLERSSATSPSQFTTLHSTNDSQRITSVVWQSDSSTLALSMAETSAADVITTTISLIPQLTMDVTQVYTSNTAPSIELMAFPSANKLFIQENNHGLISNLSVINPQTGTLDQSISHFNADGALARTKFDRQMTNGYTLSSTRIDKTNLETGDKSTIHELNTVCISPLEKNSSTLTGMSLSPSGDFIIYTEKLEYCREQRTEARVQKKDLPESRFVVYSLKDSKHIHQLNNPTITEINNSFWSTDEDFVWISQSSENAFILNLADASFTRIPNLDRQSLLKERVFPVGWLQPKK